MSSQSSPQTSKTLLNQGSSMLPFKDSTSLHLTQESSKTTPQNISKEILLGFLDGFVSQEKFRTYNVEIAKKLGDVSYAVLLNDFLDQEKYLRKEKKLTSHEKYGPDLMYYTSDQAWERCGIKKDYFDAAIRTFERLGFVKKCKFGIPCKSYYSVNRLAIAEWIFSNIIYSCGNSHNLIEEIPQQAVGIPTRNEPNNELSKDPNTTTSIEQVVDVSDDDLKKYSVKVTEFLDEKSKLLDHNLQVPLVTLIKLIKLYGITYLTDQLNYMCDQQHRAFKDQKSMKIKKTKPIDNPEVFLRIACEKNWARS